MGRWRWTGVVLAGVIVAPRAAAAGNLDSFFLGNEAALSGGAVMAMSRDAGAAWYNPAGLASLDRSSIDLSASAFVLRIRNVSRAMSLELGSEEARIDLDSVELMSVPSALVVARRLGRNLVGAVGIFVPTQETYSVDDTLSRSLAFDANGTPLRMDYRQGMQISVDMRELTGGLALGWSLTPRLRLGFSLNAIYYTAAFSGSFWVDMQLPAAQPIGRAMGVTRFEAEQTVLASNTMLGVQWEVVEGLRLAATFRSPTVQLARWSSGRQLETGAQAIPGEDPTLNLNVLEADETPSGPSFDVVRPLRLGVGVAWEIGSGWVALEADFLPAFDNEELDIHSRATWNARLGGIFGISPAIRLGAGLFTDHSVSRDELEFMDTQVDFYGGSLGMELRTTYQLDEEEASSTLVLSTTVALRYALGVGTFGGLVTSPFDETRKQRNEQVDVLFHEIGLHIGSAVYF